MKTVRDGRAVMPDTLPTGEKVDQILGQIERVLEDPVSYVRRLKSDRKIKVVGWLLTDVPEELIHAAGALPFGITGNRESLSQADAHLQVWACSLMRSCLGMGVQGKLNFLDGLIIPHTCDTTRNLGGIWKQVRPLPLMENYLVPRQVDRPSARPYLVGELGRLKARLEQCTRTEITAGKLKESISLYNRNRRLMRKLFARHVENPQILNNRAIYDIIKSSLYMPKEDHNRLLAELDQALDNEPGAGDNGKGYVRLVLSGKVWEPPEIMDILDRERVVVVGDDLATGHRYMTPDVPEKGDPFEALAHRQLSRMPCACFDTGMRSRWRFLVDMARGSGADGLVFIHLRFCEPENFDYPDMKSACESAGIPSIRLETELGNISLGQLETRLQAFLEMIAREE
ncbi:MAG: 2-hydroxyacyl-CoA dehydratase family protein [Peptococcaceae bacterium]|nr:2-hydroxyacyl-CoA dehydratase family protein [Peptococcaceae bacterium]